LPLSIPDSDIAAHSMVGAAKRNGELVGTIGHLS
jgi:hypothetical protein